MGRAASRFRERDSARLVREFAQYHLWKIDGFSKNTVVFYLTDNDVRVNQGSGVSRTITQRCYELVKQYDEFGYLDLETFPIKFDSKENLNKNYHGNMYYYFK